MCKVFFLACVFGSVLFFQDYCYSNVGSFLFVIYVCIGFFITF